MTISFALRVRAFVAARLCLLPCALIVLSNAALDAAEITCFAAASLTDSLKEIDSAYEKQTGEKVVFNFGSSNFLARQIEEGAPADIFFSADEVRMDSLEKKGLLSKETRKSRLSNSLVIVVSADNLLTIKSASDLAEPKVKRIALADPRTVPAGIYAREYLEKVKLWTSIQSKIVPTDNVRAALAAVEAGNVEAGIVYKTDASISKKLKVAYKVPASESPAISYSMAVMKEARELDAAKQFLKYLDSDQASRVFEKFGFIVRN